MAQLNISVLNSRLGLHVEWQTTKGPQILPESCLVGPEPSCHGRPSVPCSSVALTAKENVRSTVALGNFVTP